MKGELRERRSAMGSRGNFEREKDVSFARPCARARALVEDSFLRQEEKKMGFVILAASLWLNERGGTPCPFC